MEKHPLHIKTPDLQTSPEVGRAVKRQEQKTGEKIPNNPTERIEAYTDRLENIFLNPDERTRERNLEMFRDKIYDALIIKNENFPESYFELQKRIARERGQAVEEIPAAVREQMIETAIEDQRHSLDAWMEYLVSDDAVYPAWFKYYAWTQVTKLSQFDKERGEFKKRTASTVAPYPDIYREPLAQIADIYLKVKEDNINLKEPEIQEAFSKKFPTLYAELIQKSLAAQIENKEELKGQWVKYEQGDADAAEKLFLSLEGKGTGWCTAGRATAETQIKSGDFYVYYTDDANGQPTQPRLAIRMDGQDRIGEVRGILPHQGVESLLQEVLDEKLGEFGAEADAYRKKSEDMRLLTALEHKHTKGEPFTKDDLVLLYEINSNIEGFGYEKDPRIAELRKDRNIYEDIPTIFECTKDQIADTPSEITKETKVYVGELEPGIFQKFPAALEHIYTSFPERKIRKENIEVGGKSAEQLFSEMEAAGLDIIDHVRNMLFNKAEFIPTKNPEDMTFVRLSVGDLGLGSYERTEKIYERAKEFGLELCPPDTGPNFLLKYRNQAFRGENLSFGMKNIGSSIFALYNGHDGLLLHSVRVSQEWESYREFVFRLPSSLRSSSPIKVG